MGSSPGTAKPVHRTVVLWTAPALQKQISDLQGGWGGRRATASDGLLSLALSAPLFLHLGSQGPQASLGVFQGKLAVTRKTREESWGSAHTDRSLRQTEVSLCFSGSGSAQSSPRKDEESLHLLLCVHPAWLPVLWSAFS